jgi:hypothetical protein
MASGKGGEYEKDNRRGNGKRNETGTEYGRLRRVKAGSEVEIGREVVSEIEVVREVVGDGKGNDRCEGKGRLGSGFGQIYLPVFH